MQTLIPLTVAVPLLAAAILMGVSPFHGGRGLMAFALAVGGATTALCAVLLGSLAPGDPPLVYWFADYEPRSGQPVGIAFVVEVLPAAAATFAAALVTAALVFSWRHFQAVGPAYPSLMLTFLAAMVGFVLAGDLFTMFVFFELMTVVAIALTAYRPDQSAPLAGSLSFAIVNGIGAFLFLTGIAMVYAETGALNLAEIGQELADAGAEPSVAVAFGLIASGLLTKAAVIPFHFWMADTYSAAPAPVCLIFTGIMSELGLYGLARILWSGFDAAFDEALPSLRVLLVALGAATALLGSAMCLAQRHLKRMLAFATIAYVGMFLIGVGLLTDEGLAGTAIFVLADGMVKGGLFVAVGILQHRRGSVGLDRLRGQGRALPVAGALFVVGALGLAGLPPFGPFLGRALIEESAIHQGLLWVPAVLVVSEALTAAAVLRAAGHVFGGWGSPVVSGGEESGRTAADAEGEADPTGRDRTPWTMGVTGVALMVAGMGLAFVPGLADRALVAAHQLIEGPQYLGPGPVRDVATEVGTVGPHLRDYVLAAVSVLGAVALAALALWRPEWVRRRLRGPIRAGVVAMSGLRGLHSGHTGEYVGWLTVGAAAFTGAVAVIVT